MLVTKQQDNRNHVEAVCLASACALLGIGLTVMSSAWLLMLPLAGLIYYAWRRRSRRRRWVIAQPFPDSWLAALNTHVAYFRVLDDTQRSRFKQLMQVFVDEVAITGIRTDVDETTRALVAASAVIPIFGFDDWEYAGLGEVLIYPRAYNEEYDTDGATDERILGMVGAGHLSGVMILSKPDLISGFDNATDKRNVGIHEFSHLVDKADGAIDGIAATIPHDVIKPWIDWVGRELRNDAVVQTHINNYAYTNEAEYFAVLSEYFFESPAVLQKKNPQLYQMLEKIYRQNTKRLFQGPTKSRQRIGRNAPCPCGSGEKFKRCCKA